MSPMSCAARPPRKPPPPLAEALPAVRVGIVHGRMPPKQKDQAMQEFKAGKIQLLVATTVIEVGVDVPNATLMVIENAERMGLAQLHQLRGRVGRGSHESSCVLLYRAPLSQLARERLAAIRETNDGFEIARRDLELRGPGELLGTRQTGLAQLRVADLIRDADLLPQVREAAELLLRDDSPCIAPLRQRWIGARARNMAASADEGCLRLRRGAADRPSRALDARCSPAERPSASGCCCGRCCGRCGSQRTGGPIRTSCWCSSPARSSMRSAGCVINDFADRNIDPHVKRTRDRPLAARRISPLRSAGAVRRAGRCSRCGWSRGSTG